MRFVCLKECPVEPGVSQTVRSVCLRECPVEPSVSQVERFVHL